MSQGVAIFSLSCSQFSSTNPEKPLAFIHWVAGEARFKILLSGLGPIRRANEAIFDRAKELRVEGLKDIDALHLAFAESQKSEYFITCDDDIVRKSGRMKLRLKVANPVKFVEDLDI